MRSFLKLIGRVGNAILDALNVAKKKDAANHAADNLSNGGRVQQSSKSFTDLANKPDDDSAK